MQCSPSCEQKMPPTQFAWKLKASSSSSTSGSSSNRFTVLFGRAKTAYPLFSSAKSSLGARARRISPSGSSPPPPDSSLEDGAPLSMSEAFSRAFATPSVFGPAWQSCSYQSWQLLIDGRIVTPACPKASVFGEFSLGGEGKDGKESWSKWIENTFVKGVGGSQQIQHLEQSAAFHCARLGHGLHSFGSESLAEQARIGLNTSRRDVNLVSPGTSFECEQEKESSSFSEGTAGQRKSLSLVSGACYLPHPDKEAKGGEDAHFICDNERVVGVADGVGGWADVGIDAGQYARELMSQSLMAAREEPQGLVNPIRILRRAHARTKCRGSSTACILALCEQGLQAANLGDSGFIVVRGGKTVFKSPTQQHLFNIPYQLENGGSDPPSCAQVFTVQVAAGDVIVVGTDGLFDNVYDSELTAVIVQSTRSGFGPQVTAQKLASRARLHSQDRNMQTPFAAAAQDAGYRFYGGKLDDITVVVSYVTTSKA